MSVVAGEVVDIPEGSSVQDIKMECPDEFRCEYLEIYINDTMRNRRYVLDRKPGQKTILFHNVNGTPFELYGPVQLKIDFIDLEGKKNAPGCEYWINTSVFSFNETAPTYIRQDFGRYTINQTSSGCDGERILALEGTLATSFIIHFQNQTSGSIRLLCGPRDIPVDGFMISETKAGIVLPDSLTPEDRCQFRLVCMDTRFRTVVVVTNRIEVW